MDAPEFHDLFFGNDDSAFNQTSDGAQDVNNWEFEYDDFLGDVQPPAQNQAPATGGTTLGQSNGYNHGVISGVSRTQNYNGINGGNNFPLPPIQELPKFDNAFSNYPDVAALFPESKGMQTSVPEIQCTTIQYSTHADQSNYNKLSDSYHNQQKLSSNSYGSLNLGSSYQKTTPLPPSPYTKSIESPYGSVKSDSPYKPHGSPYSVGKPIESPYSMGKPIESPYGMSKPIESPYGMSKPVESPYSQGKPVESPYSVNKPVDSPYGSKPTESPYSASKPLGSPYGMPRTANSPYSLSKPAESPYGFENGLRPESAYQVIKPVESPFSKPVESPYSLPRSVESQHMYGRSLDSPYGMPRSVENPQFAAKPLESPYSMPRSVDNPLLTSRSLGSPYSMPRSVENPQLMGRPVDSSYNMPKMVENLSYSTAKLCEATSQNLQMPTDSSTCGILKMPEHSQVVAKPSEHLPVMLEAASFCAQSRLEGESSWMGKPALNLQSNHPDGPLPMNTDGNCNSEVSSKGLIDSLPLMGVGANHQPDSEANHVLDDIAQLINKQVENFTAGALNDSFCSSASDEGNKSTEENMDDQLVQPVATTETEKMVCAADAESRAPVAVVDEVVKVDVNSLEKPKVPDQMEVDSQCPIDKKLEMLFREEKAEVKPEPSKKVLDTIDEVERKLEALHSSSGSDTKPKPAVSLGISEVFQTPPSTSSSPCDLQSVTCDKSKQVQSEAKSAEQSTSALLSPSSNEGDANQRVKNCSCILCQEHFSRRRHRKKRKREELNSLTFKSEVCTDKIGIKLKISRSSTCEPSPPLLEPQVPIPVPTPRPRPDYSLMKPDFLKDPNFMKKSKKQAKRKKAKKRKHQSSDSEDFEGFQDWQPQDLQMLSQPVPTGKVSSKGSPAPTDQSPWATRMPAEILQRIFMDVTDVDGCLPSLVRLSKVCRSWHKVASDSKLWHTIDLSSHCVKERHRTERKLVWLLQNRLTGVKDLNLGGWNSALRPGVIQLIASGCSQLEGISFHGCSAVTQDHMIYLAHALKNLQRLDLSNVSDITQSGKSSPVSQSAISEIAKVMGPRLTHLNLAGNSTSGISNAILAVAANCCNLEVLDLSNVKTYNRDHALINIEKLQAGCKKLRVLRLTNIQLRLAPSSSKDQAMSQGFPDLEELSLAVSSKNDFGIDDLALERIVKTSTKLRLLDVRGCVAISYSSLVRVPAWDLEQLFLSGCKATRYGGDGLELVIQKWGHSLEILDLSWSTSPEALDLALATLAGQENSPLKSLDLNGSAVGYTAVKTLLEKCINLTSLNLSSCRSLPRGMKRNYANPIEVAELRSAIEAGRFDEKPDSDHED